MVDHIWPRLINPAVIRIHFHPLPPAALRTNENIRISAQTERVEVNIHVTPASWVITSVATSEILPAAWSFSIRTSDNYLLQPTPPVHSIPLHFSFICPTTGLMKRSFRLGFAIVIKSCYPFCMLSGDQTEKTYAQTCGHFLHRTRALTSQTELLKEGNTTTGCVT
jgi:hypothetical protein